MGIGGLSAATLATIATELNTFFAAQIAPQAATVNYLSANNSITIASLVRNGGTGVVQSTSQVAAPANGNLTVGTPASLAVSYSHTAANTCSDTFQVAGTGAATTAARTVNITITPPTLTATNSAAAIAYNSTGFTAVPLNLTGPASGITITTNLPANSGTLQTAGGAISYQADPVNYVPQVTFQYRATGPCGSQSAIATVTLNVNPPGPPGANPVAANVAFQTATAVTANVVGPFDLLTIVTAPVNGMVPAPALNATSFTYTPRAGFIGTDTFTYTARAPGGGASPSATVTITVLPPGALVANNRSANVAFNAPTAIDLAANVTGFVSSVAVVGGSVTNGTATAAGTVVTFTPTTGYFGPAVFQYTAVAPGGAVSAAATVSLTVGTQAPGAGAAAMTVQLNTPGTLDLAPFITGSAITGVQIASNPTKGTVTVSGTRVIYTPVNDFFGSDTFTYQAFGNAGTSAPGRVTVTVIGRPDPTKNAATIGILSAQADTARRFAQGQTSNYQRRLEALRSGRVARETRGAAGGSAVARNNVPSNVRNTEVERQQPANVVEPVRLAALNTTDTATDGGGSGLVLPSFVSDLVSAATSRSINVAQLTGARGTDTATLGSREVTYWMDGTVSFGSRDATGTRSALEFTTSGVTAGLDYRVTDKLVLGVGVGYARDRTSIGVDGTKNRSQGYSVAGYGSYQPTPNTFIDGLIGAGSLRFDSDRVVAVANDVARANRDGSQYFGALIAGYELRRNGMLWSPYGRVDYSVNKLDQATESGAGLNALTYFAQRQKSLQGALGLRVESAHEVEFGWVVPRMRGEYRYDGQGAQQVSIAYADQVVTGPRYALNTGPLDRNTYVFGVGADFVRRNGITMGIDYQINVSGSQSRSQTARFVFQYDLDGKPRRPGFFEASGEPGPLDLQFDGGYSFDDNVNRAANRTEKLLDHSFSANLSKNWVIPFEGNEKFRLLTSALLGGERFKNYNGLSRAIASVTGDLQYRTSAEFDAVTLGLFGKAFYEQFESDSRDGYRYSFGVSASQSLTDRITVFGALAREERYARSAVFEGKHNSARANIDYALNKDGTLYLTGEHRRGDTVSTARPTLANLDIARVFRADDVFDRGLTSYRVDAKTWIATIGYNLGYGERNSLDISWRRAQSLTLQAPSFAAPRFKYVVNQFNLVYLMRF